MRIGLGIGLGRSSQGQSSAGGALAGTLGALTLAAAATVSTHGTATLALDPIAATSAAQVKVQGTASITLDALTASSGGTHSVQGTLSSTLGALVLVAAGTAKVQGVAAPTLGSLTSSATGTVKVQGTSTPTLGALTLAATGTVKVQGTATPTLAAATLSATGTVSSAAGITFVGGKTVAITGSIVPDNTISLTDLTGGSGSAPAADDIVIVNYCAAGTSDLTFGVTTSGYTEVAELYANDNNDTNLSVSWKRMSGSPDTSVDVSPTGAIGNGGAVSIHVWRGVNTTTAIDVTTTTATGTNTGRPNPAAITPTTAGAYIVVCGGGTAAFPVAFTQSGSELSNFISIAEDDTVLDAVVGMGSKAWTSGAFDPVAWTGGSSNAADSWAAATLALRPA